MLVNHAEASVIPGNVFVGANNGQADGMCISVQNGDGTFGKE